MLEDKPVRKMSENGKGCGSRISTKQTRENYSSGYDNITWGTKDDCQEQPIKQEKNNED